jgi:hypothetical protein
MPTATRAGLLARKPTKTLEAEARDESGLRRAVGALDLTALGIGGIIGTGIFVSARRSATRDRRSSSASSWPPRRACSRR